MSTVLTVSLPKVPPAACVFAVCLVWGLLLPGAARAAEDSAGFVLDISGVWFLEGTVAQKLSGGDKLPVGATVYPQKTDPKTFIVVCLYTGQAQTYSAKMALPKRIEPSLAHRFWGAIQGHYRGGVVHAISRGEVLADGVGQWTPQGIDVRPVVEKLPAGSHLIRLTTQASVGQSETKIAPIEATIQWDPTNKQTLATGQLTPALYKVELLDSRTRQPTGSEALLLACPASSYQQQLKAYDEAVVLTKGWDDQARKSGAGPFLQSYLAALADDHAR